MNFIPMETSEELVCWASSLAQIMEARGRMDLSREIAEQIRKFQQNSFTIAVIGKAKRGKSTLINALMGRQDDILAPIDKLPASSTVTSFQWSDNPGAEVFFKAGGSEKISWERIRNYVTEEFNPENCKGVSLVQVEGPIDGLRNGVELVDTPGAGSIHEYHDAILHAFIPHADAVIFIASAQMPFDRDELELLAQVKKADVSKIFFVLNRVDEIDEEEELLEALQHNQALLRQAGITCERMYQISAKQAFQGKSGSGVETLVHSIRDFISRERLLVLQKRFLSRVCALIEPELHALSVQLASIHKSREQIDEEIALLQSEYRKMETHRIQLEDSFMVDWENAVNQLHRQFISAEPAVRSALSQKIKGLKWSIGSPARKVPTILVNELEETLHPLTSDFESKVQEICRKIQAAYPVLEITADSQLVLKVSGLGKAVALIGGAGTAALGGTLVYAGGAAAASIAAANTTAGTLLAAETALGVGSWFAGMPMLGKVGGGILSWLSPGFAAAPAWVALSGPVGWTVVGLGVLVIPLGWGISKSNQFKKVDEAVSAKLTEIFKYLKESRISELREMGRSILRSMRESLEEKKKVIEAGMQNAWQISGSESLIQELKAQNQEIQRLMVLAKTFQSEVG